MQVKSQQNSSFPRFSFVMPAYQAEMTIADSIKSVLAQDFDNWELIICNDGSQDKTEEIARSYSSEDVRIRVVSQENAGCGAARDAAVRASRGEWIVRLDADDILFSNYLLVMDAFICKSPGFDIYSCNGVHLYPDGSSRQARPGRFYEKEKSFSYEDMLQATHIFTVAIFSRDLFDRIGGISPTEYCEDLDFWLRALAQEAKHRYTPHELAEYHVSDTQMTADFSKIVESRTRIYQKLINSGLLSEKQKKETQKAIKRVLRDERVFEMRTNLVVSISNRFGTHWGRRTSSAVHFVGKTVGAPIRILFYLRKK